MFIQRNNSYSWRLLKVLPCNKPVHNEKEIHHFPSVHLGRESHHEGYIQLIIFKSDIRNTSMRSTLACVLTDNGCSIMREHLSILFAPHWEVLVSLLHKLEKKNSADIPQHGSHSDSVISISLCIFNSLLKVFCWLMVTCRVKVLFEVPNSS